MARKKRNKKQEAIPAEFAKVETALKTRIEEIEQLPDPAEQLLKYQDLYDLNFGTYDEYFQRTDKEGTYDKSKVRFTREESVDFDAMDGGWKGFGSGVVGYAVGAIAFTASGVSLPVLPVLAGVALVIGSAVLIIGGSAFAGYRIGKKKANSAYDKLSPEEKHATRMSRMTSGIGKAIDGLKSYFEQDKNLEALERSPYSKAVQSKFPRIATKFNQYAQRRKARALLEQTPAPRAQAPGLAA